MNNRELALCNSVRIAADLNTGAAAMIVAERSWAEKSGLKPVAKLVPYGIAAVGPDFFGMGPAPASRQALEML